MVLKTIDKTRVSWYNEVSSEIKKKQMKILNEEITKDGYLIMKIRGICRKVGKVGESKEAIYGTYTNIGNGIVEYTSSCGDDESIDDLTYIGVLETQEMPTQEKDRYSVVTQVELLKTLGTSIFS